MALERYRGAVDADLRHYYYADLPDLYNGKLNPWRVAAWLEHLPPDSALRRAGGGGWTVSDYLLADAVDGINAGNWQRGNAGAKPGKASKKPDRVIRPGDDVPRRTVITVADIKEFRKRTRREVTSGD